MSTTEQMIDPRLFTLEPGELVEVIMDSGEARQYIIKYPAWQLDGGTWVIGLVGIAGGYALYRCRIVETEPK